jgi:peptide/nickel transport system ATP-binding protein
MSSPLLEVVNLTVAYRHGEGWTRAVDDVAFTIAAGEVLGLVGESGCGKSTVALQALGYRHPALRVEAGSVALHGQVLTGLPRPDLDRLRGRRVSFVPQNPTTALNPGIRVGAQIAEILAAHGLTGSAARPPGEIFALVGLPADAAFRRRYPHQLSGGQQQRVCIAMALACDPDLVVLDEPTTGLDVTTQAQIVALLADLRARLGMSMLYVTHDLALLSQIADRVGVMYAGRMVEVAPTENLFRAPRHPYTQGLIASIPQAPDATRMGSRPLRGLLRRADLPPGCPFQPRCDHALPRCAETVQPLLAAGPEHAVACWRWRDIVGEAAPNAAVPARPAAAARPLIDVAGLSIAYGAAPPVVRDVSLALAEGETLALVGESGSGKSTIARAIRGLIAPVAGRIRLQDKPLAPLVRARSREERRLIQLIFQNPDASINPRARIARTLRRPVDHFFPEDAPRSREQIAAALA